MIPRNDYGERCQFDAYCKLVLYHEAIDYLREMQRRRDRELSFSDLPQMEMDKLSVVDHLVSRLPPLTVRPIQARFHCGYVSRDTQPRQ